MTMMERMDALETRVGEVCERLSRIESTTPEGAEPVLLPNQVRGCYAIWELAWIDGESMARNPGGRWLKYTGFPDDSDADTERQAEAWFEANKPSTSPGGGGSTFDGADYEGQRLTFEMRNDGVAVARAEDGSYPWWATSNPRPEEQPPFTALQAHVRGMLRDFRDRWETYPVSRLYAGLREAVESMQPSVREYGDPSGVISSEPVMRLIREDSFIESKRALLNRFPPLPNPPTGPVWRDAPDQLAEAGWYWASDEDDGREDWWVFYYEAGDVVACDRIAGPIHVTEPVEPTEEES